MLLLRKRLDGIDAAFDTSRTLEIQLTSCLRHFLGKLSNKLVVIARQKPLDAFDVFLVLIRRDAATTGSRTQSHMAVKARTHARISQKRIKRAAIGQALDATPFRARCRTQRHHAARNVYHLACRSTIGEGSEIFRSFTVLFTRVFDGGENISRCERDERITFIVFEVRVEKRRVLLDQVVFQNKRLMLIFHHNIIERLNLIHQQRNLRAIVLEIHVLAHAGAQLFCLANVDNGAFCVFP